MNCPRCNAPVIPGAPYCTNCNLNFAAVYPQQHAPVTESKPEKRYRILLIILALFFVFDGIFWRIMDKLADTFGYEIYDYTDAYSWLTGIAYGAVPGLIGFLLPKTTPWRLILIIGGCLWFAFRLYDRISSEFFQEDFVYFQF